MGQIPDFDASGYLPHGDPYGANDGVPVYLGHDADLPEIRHRFVGKYPDSFTRDKLHAEFQHLFDIATTLLPCITVYLSGEFVTNVEDPESVFVALDAPAGDLDGLEPEALWVLMRLFQSEYVITQHHLKVETALVRAYPPDNARFAWSDAERLFHREAAGTPNPQTDPDGGRGYVQIIHCEGGWNTLAPIFGTHPAGDPPS